MSELGRTYNKIVKKSKKTPAAQASKEQKKTIDSLEILKEMNVTVFYPVTWHERDGSLNVSKILNTLIQSDTIFLIYENEVKGHHAKKLIIDSYNRGLDLQKAITLKAVSENDYKQLYQGNWSVVGVVQESEDEYD